MLGVICKAFEGKTKFQGRPLRKVAQLLYASCRIPGTKRQPSRASVAALGFLAVVLHTEHATCGNIGASLGQVGQVLCGGVEIGFRSTGTTTLKCASAILGPLKRGLSLFGRDPKAGHK
jgi:hypothetical protein